MFFTLNRSSTRRHPAHPVSVLIRHPRKISSVVTSYDTEIMHRNAFDNAMYTIQGRTLLPPLRTWSELAGVPPIVLRQHVLGQAPGLRRNPVVFQRYGAVFPPRRASRYNSEQEKCVCQQRRQAGIHIRRYTLAYQQTPPFSYMIYQANVYQHRIYS